MKAIGHFLATLWRYWKKFGQFMGDLVGRLVLMLFYLTITLPFGLGVRLFGNPLDIGRKGSPASWIARKAADTTLQGGYNQF